MPPALATLLTAAFVLWLFHSNRRRPERYARALWLPTLWVVVFASRPIGYWFGAGGDNAEFESYLDGSPIDRNVLALLILGGIVVLWRRHLDWNVILTRNIWLASYYLFCGLSIAWAEYPFVAFKRWFKEIGTVLMVLVIMTDRAPAKALKEVFVRCAFILLPASVLVLKYYLHIGVAYNPWTGDPMICGVTTDKNALGRLSFVSALFLLWRLIEDPTSQGWFSRLRRNLPEALGFCLSIWLLFKADSSTSKGCFIAGLMVLVTARSRILAPWRRAIGAGVLLMAIASFVVLISPGCRTTIAESLGRRGDLTDRTDIWKESLNLGTDPLIGAGYRSVWLTESGRQLREKMAMAHSHNGYLETYLNTGLVGLALLLAAVATAGGNVYRQLVRGDEDGPLLASLFLCCAIYNYTEVAFDNMSIVGVIMWALAIKRPSGSLGTESSNYDVPTPEVDPGLTQQERQFS